MEQAGEGGQVQILTLHPRINTILDSDKVLVLDKGQIIEFDNPQRLLSNPKSVFFSLAKEGGVLADYTPSSQLVTGYSSAGTTPRKPKGKARRFSSSSSSSSSSSESLVPLDEK
jgi:ABC-type proline/glycine betaine transport system ATPase subunit